MKFIFAVFAGCFGSLGSVFAKFSSNFQSRDSVLAYWNMVVYISSIVLMVLCNSIGLFFFTKSLHYIDNTVVASLLSMASNYILSGILGMLLFEETLSVYWLVGTTFAFVGVFLIATDESKVESSHEDRKEGSYIVEKED